MDRAKPDQRSPAVQDHRTSLEDEVVARRVLGREEDVARAGIRIRGQGHGRRMEALRVAIKRDYLSGGEYFGRYREDDIERICGIQQGILQQKRLHNYKDQLHGGGCLRILRQYVTSREMQEQTFWATRLSRQLRVITQREQRRMARAAVGLPADNLFVG